MKYLLDTCVLSELVRSRPDEQVIDWLQRQDSESLYVSIITIGEIEKGIHYYAVEFTIFDLRGKKT